MGKKKSSIFFFIILSVFVFYMCNRAAEMYMSSEGNTVERLISSIDSLFSSITENFFYISLDSNNMIFGIIGVVFVLLIYLYNAFGSKKYMHGVEHGSAEWGTKKDMSGYTDKNPYKNIILTKTEQMTMDTRKTFRNNNVLVVGGSGSGKTRFYVKPNIMQLHSSYVITDPKGQLLKETGKMLKDADYKIKVLNLIDMPKSDKYNFFDYIKEEKDILKLVKNLMINTNDRSKNTGGDFWEKAETALLQALFAFVYYEALPEERNILTVMEMLRLAEVREEEEGFQSPLDIMFDELKKEKPNHFASKQYDLFKLAAGKTAKSILVSVGVRLSPFNIDIVSELLCEDTIEIDTIGDEKTALFIIISDSDTTFNFISAMMYQQLFDILFYKADNVFNGRLPFHVRFLLDEFANIGQIPSFDTYIATMRSREISANIILQNLAQIKSLYKNNWETITGNCDSFLFLGGNEQSTLEYISKLAGKTTIDLKTINESKGNTGGYSVNNQVLGRSLLTPDEVARLPETECILFIRGKKPFKSAKFDIEKHQRYKLLSDYNKNNIYKSEDGNKEENFLNMVELIEEVTI